MIVIVNGIRKEFEEQITLQRVISNLGLDDKVMAAAVNMEIVKQENWINYELNNEDKIELLDFVGGG
jgi:sulfur carrier protein